MKVLPGQNVHDKSSELGCSNLQGWAEEKEETEHYLG